MGVCRNDRPRTKLMLTAALVMVSSCAVKTPLDLRPPQQAPEALVASSEGRRAEAISVARPRDLRSSKEIMRWESIAVFQFVPTSEPALWVGDSIANGLEQAGFRVTAIGNVTDSKTPVALDIAITELGITYAGKPPLIGFPYCTGELTIKATIFDRGQQTFERSYTGDDERQCWNPVPDTMSAILDVLMQKMLERALPDLSAQLLKAAGSEHTAAASAN